MNGKESLPLSRVEKHTLAHKNMEKIKTCLHGVHGKFESVNVEEDFSELVRASINLPRKGIFFKHCVLPKASTLIASDESLHGGHSSMLFEILSDAAVRKISVPSSCKQLVLKHNQTTEYPLLFPNCLYSVIPPKDKLESQLETVRRDPRGKEAAKIIQGFSSQQLKSMKPKDIVLLGLAARVNQSLNLDSFLSKLK